MLRLVERRQLAMSCWGKKSRKLKVMHGIRYVSKKMIKNKMIQSCEQDLFLFVINCLKRRQITRLFNSFMTEAPII